MTRVKYELGDIFRLYGSAYRQAHYGSLSLSQIKVMEAIEKCRTADLGGHKDECDNCSFIQYSYNSCRNRHCPKCQSLARAEWLMKRKDELLPVAYHHMVFSLPHCLEPLVLQNKSLLYNMLFDAVNKAITKVAACTKYLGATIGFISMLHTWSQTLLSHTHIHCLIPSG